MRRYTTKNRSILSQSLQFLIADLRTVNIALIIGKTSLMSNMRNRHWIVTRNNLKCHIFWTQVFQSFCSILTNRIGNFKQGQSLDIIRQNHVLCGNTWLTPSQNQNTRPSRLSLIDCFRILLKKHLRCSQKESSKPIDAHSTPFTIAWKWNNITYLIMMFQTLISISNSLSCCVFILAMLHISRKQTLQLLFRKTLWQ